KLVKENIEICEVYKNIHELEERYIEFMNVGFI
ncbi:ABC transporter ATP-binding protein, partial [Clostridium botulinum]|nr:ABC transporter ATP-binding protein [Clostridium botulinum]